MTSRKASNQVSKRLGKQIPRPRHSNLTMTHVADAAGGGAEGAIVFETSVNLSHRRRRLRLDSGLSRSSNSVRNQVLNFNHSR